MLSSRRLEGIRGLATLQITHTQHHPLAARAVASEATPERASVAASLARLVPILPKYVPDASKSTLGAQTFPGGAPPLEWAASLHALGGLHSPLNISKSATEDGKSSS